MRYLAGIVCLLALIAVAISAVTIGIELTMPLIRAYVAAGGSLLAAAGFTTIYKIAGWMD